MHAKTTRSKWCVDDNLDDTPTRCRVPQDNTSTVAQATTQARVGVLVSSHTLETGSHSWFPAELSGYTSARKGRSWVAPTHSPRVHTHSCSTSHGSGARVLTPRTSNNTCDGRPTQELAGDEPRTDQDDDSCTTVTTPTTKRTSTGILSLLTASGL